MLPAKKYQDDLTKIKSNIKTSYDYFKPNYDRYHLFRRFIFETSLTDNEKIVLQKLGKPVMEFNMSEAYISRLRGEFAKQEPSLSVNSIGGQPIDENTLMIVEGHTRAILFDANNDAFEYDVYMDLLSGGFSVIKVMTDYASEMGTTAFDQDIKVKRAFDPTLCGFDINALLPHKSDGNYAFEYFVKNTDAFKAEFGSAIKLDDLKFTKESNGFNWSYRTQKNEDMLLICDYYEKKKRKAKIVQLASGQVMTTDDYEQFLEKWSASGRLEQPPTATRSRQSAITTICRSRLIENQVIDYEETDFKYLPLVFVDGNSVLLRKNNGSGDIQQMTRPYLYHGKDQQRLINFAGQTLGNELENIVQSKWLMPIEGLPDEPEYTEALLNNQQGNIVLFNAYRSKTDQKPLPPPREVQRQQTPPEVMGTFMGGAQNMQAILGSYDAALGINDNELSGIAIQEAATQSNSAAMPYITGFLQGLNQVAQIIVDLIPKYYITPRTIPVTMPNGKRGFVPVNQQNGMSLNYDANSLQVRIEAGVNFNIQKSRTLQQIVGLSKAMPIFGQFMNQKGLRVLVKNLEGHAMDELEEMAEQFMQEMQQMQKKQAQQPNPIMLKEQNAQQLMQLKSQELQFKQTQLQSDNQFRAQEISNDQNDIDNDRLKIMLEQQQAGINDAVQIKKAQAEERNDAAQLVLKAADTHHKHTLAVHDQLHRHTKEALELANDTASIQNQIEQSNKPQPIGENQNG
jgi:hypothetical protein